MHGIARLIAAQPRRKRLPRLAFNHQLRKEVVDELFPRLRFYVNNNPLVRRDSLSDDAYEAIENFKIQFLRKYGINELKRLALKQGQSLNRYNQEQLSRVIGINVFGNEPWLEDRMAMFAMNNAHLIKTIPERFFNDVSSITFDALKKGTPWDDMQDELMGRFGVSDWNAERLARDQISKLNAGLNQFRQEDIGVDGYFWRGTLDQRERDSHRAHEGIRYAWNDPPADTGHPGDDILCRCWAEPDLAKFYE